MTLNIQMPVQQNALRPIITVVGVGGAGGNAVNNMISAQLEGVEFVVANTDAQALESALTDQNIQLGRNITQGLGAGATPEVGQAAAEEAAQEIGACIDGSNMVFITAGMGGGTGTGAAPVVARMAREQGMLTVGVVTRPFQFEGAKRMKIADAGIAELQKYVDTLIVIPNQNLFRIANEKTTFADAFRMADEVLHSGVRGVTDLMVKPGLVNLDFADIRTVMQEMGKAMMGTGEASGEKRAIEASEAAISNPLLDDVSLKGARAALINITGGPDMTLYEVDEAANRIREEIDSDANIIFGSTFHEAMQGSIRVSVVATGIDIKEEQLQAAPTATTRNFNKPAQRQASTKAAAPSFSSVTTAAKGAYGRKDNAAKVAASTAPAAAQPAQAVQPEAPQEARYDNTPSRRSYVEESSYNDVAVDTTSYDNQQGTTGSLFVNDRTNQEQPHYNEQAQDAPYEQQEGEEDSSSGSFKFFNKIADVGRSLNTRHEPEVRNRTIAVSEGQSAPATETHEQYAEEPRQSVNADDDYYDIPTFLRRQAN